MESVKLAEEAKKMLARMEKPFREDDIEVLAKELYVRVVMIARSGRMLADAKHILASAKRAAIVTIMDDGHAPKGILLRELILASCADEQRLVDIMDRMNAALSHQIDGIRSLLSTEKEHMIAERGSHGSNGGSHHQPRPERMED